MLSKPVRERGYALGLALVATGSLVSAGPCDIYASGGNPCIAAHSTTRALYSAYTGSLYQVKRGSDGATTNIAPLSAGGVANAAAQDTFCSGTTCLISVIYDQSGKGNHLTQAPGGAFSGPDVNGNDNLASAIGAPVTLNGQKAYGVFVSPGTGYRNNAAVGTAIGDVAEGMYAVLDGTHYNGGCCFDYGNAETSSTDTGNGHMEAIYFGDNTGWGSGAGSGPWLMADLENGLFSGVSPANNPGDPTITNRFFTAVVKGGPNLWALRGANAASGGLTTYYSGNSVQANIVAAKYATTSLNSGTALTVGNSISLRATTSGYTDRYLAHTGSTVNTQVVTSSSTTALKQQASWTLAVNANDGSKQFKEDATFCTQSGISGTGSSFRAWSYPTTYFRHYNNLGYAARNGGVHTFDSATSFNADVSWVIATGFA
ncbi:alpha-L-arabinofuranosidase B [Colletotrichum scovillei]|uniref:alpha-L-arabinofuranosidase B n=1 Tax=Colletotrichum scovillei TaxID=1209932 RepID=UPI0015C2D584|nr:alpha-L-arabinofuranosidase B [Colletotrichum scovillei]XP_035338225.1 alpha-L-arabinofuranosidase B [Colletotrichum scovillei]KAF4772854.1 alpha-L-arabinofuranosidase B [Colletotrichum scovillei]KAF4785222.1 alpha-L-arabinofuranosidase B [Colletotrichum scovillei]